MSSISISAVTVLCALLSLLVPRRLLTLIILQWYLFAIYEAPNETVQDTIRCYIRHDLPCKFRYVRSNPNPPNVRLPGANSWVYQCIYKGRRGRSLFRFFFFSFKSRLYVGWYLYYPPLGNGHLRWVPHFPYPGIPENSYSVR